MGMPATATTVKLAHAYGLAGSTTDPLLLVVCVLILAVVIFASW